MGNLPFPKPLGNLLLMQRAARSPPPQNQSPFHQQQANLFSFHPLKIIRVPGWSSVKHPKAGEGEAVKGTWNKWPLRAMATSVYAAKVPLLLFLRRLPLL